MSAYDDAEKPVFEYDYGEGHLLREGRAVAKYAAEQGVYTVSPMIPELSHMEPVESANLGMALLEFAQNCRSDPAACLVLNLH